MNYKSYLDSSLEALRNTLVKMECRPILFIGSGITRRYLGGPSWKELLENLIDDNPIIDKPLAYFMQMAGGSLAKVASLLEDYYYQYAWQNTPGELFPCELYEVNIPKGAFLKFQVCWIFRRLMSAYSSIEDNPYAEEIKALSSIEPHAIISTNYDSFLESLFPGFETVIGQQIVKRTSFVSIGEILKIHGCASDPSSIVVSEEDYQNFVKRKKYLTAKLLTYLLEFPVIILGHSVSDSNIQGLFSDIAEIFPDDDNLLVRNIWFIDWCKSIDPTMTPPTDKYIDIGEGRNIRVNYIQLSGFSDLYSALSQHVAIRHVDAKLLRTLAANVYDVIKSKSARGNLEVNVATLNGLSDSENLLNVLGFGFVEHPSLITELFPYNLSNVAKKLGYKNWYGAHRLLEEIKEKTGIDIRASNNEYHQDFGNDTHFGKYSEKMVELLKKVKIGVDYDLSL